MNEQNDYMKGFLVGALVGGLAGAVTALLLAPKPGVELRKDLAEKSGDVYNKSKEYWGKVDEGVSSAIKEGKEKARKIIGSAKDQADNIINNAENILKDAKEKAENTKEKFEDNFSRIKDATKASVETFKTEMKQA